MTGRETRNTRLPNDPTLNSADDAQPDTGHRTPDTETSALRNIGPKSSQWLADCGIFTEADLAHFGSVIAYRIVKDAGYPASLNLLYALEAALKGIDWRDLDKSEKERLRREAGE